MEASGVVGHPNRGSLAVGPRERVEKSNGIAVSPPPFVMWMSFGLPRRARLPDSSRYPNSTSFARSKPRLPFASCSPSESLHGYYVSRIEQYTFSWTTVFSPRLGRSPPSVALHRKRCHRLTQGRPIIASRHPPSRRSPSDPGAPRPSSSYAIALTRLQMPAACLGS